jgi:hypothetical protein
MAAEAILVPNETEGVVEALINIADPSIWHDFRKKCSILWICCMAGGSEGWQGRCRGISSIGTRQHN